MKTKFFLNALGKNVPAKTKLSIETQSTKNKFLHSKYSDFVSFETLISDFNSKISVIDSSEEKEYSKYDVSEKNKKTKKYHYLNDVKFDNDLANLLAIHNHDVVKKYIIKAYYPLAAEKFLFPILEKLNFPEKPILLETYNMEFKKIIHTQKELKEWIELAHCLSKNTEKTFLFLSEYIEPEYCIKYVSNKYSSNGCEDYLVIEKLNNEEIKQKTSEKKVSTRKMRYPSQSFGREMDMDDDSDWSDFESSDKKNIKNVVKVEDEEMIKKIKDIALVCQKDMFEIYFADKKIVSIKNIKSYSHIIEGFHS